MTVKVLPNDDHSRLARIGAVGADTPIRLKDACRDVFNDTISVATLMAEHRRGNLVIYKIGRQYFTTWRELNAMWSKCGVPAPTESRREGPSRASSIEESRLGAMQTVRTLKVGRKRASR